MTSAGYACDATGGVTTEEWEVRTTFPVYVIAMSSIAAWFLLMVFGGVGMAAIPIDLLKAYVGRPAEGDNQERVHAHRGEDRGGDEGGDGGDA